MEIKNRVAVVSGGASGLGEATARHLVSEGARVVLCDLQEEQGRQVATELGEQALFVKTDVTDVESVEAAFQQAIASFGSVNIAISCAGIVIGEKILGRQGLHDAANFHKVIEVNLIGTFHILRQAAAVMRSNETGEDGERGVIIQTASVAAFEGQIGQTAYSASKGGVASLTLPAARELAREGIRVCSIAPGIFETPMMEGMPDKVRQSLEEQAPFPKRLGKPGEFASLVAEIVRNRMLNGVTIRLDGAIRMQPR